MFPELGHWLPVKDGDPRAYALVKRHYSARIYKDNRERFRTHRPFVGPGKKMVLMTRDCDALFAWSVSQHRLDDQVGVNCTIFRNESPTKSSLLILEADTLAWQRWPGERLFTFVNADKIKSTNPGYCFKMAGWKQCGVTKGGLIILECLL